LNLRGRDNNGNNLLAELNLIDTIREMRLPYLRFSLTRDCNAGCKFCHNEGQSLGTRKAEAKPSDSYLSESQIKYIADFFAPLFREVKFTGGEPCLVKNLDRIVGIFADRGYQSSITTNGFIFDKQMQKRLRDAGLGRVNISLPSLNVDEHAEFFSVSGYLPQTLRNLEDASRVYDGNLKINFMAMPTNIPAQLLPINDLSGRLGITVSCLDLVKNRDLNAPVSARIIGYLTEQVGIASTTETSNKFSIKKIFRFKNDGSWEVDDFRREEYRDDAFSNPYCQECNLRPQCVEGPYALRVGFSGTARPCLLRNDNVTLLVNGRFGSR